MTQDDGNMTTLEWLEAHKEEILGEAYLEFLRRAIPIGHGEPSWATRVQYYKIEPEVTP